MILEKKIENRRAILFPDVRKLGYSHEIKEVNDPTRTIIVFGDASMLPSNFEVLYGQYIREAIARMRKGNVHIAPGFDGEYGKIRIFKELEKEEIKGQITLF